MDWPDESEYGHHDVVSIKIRTLIRVGYHLIGGNPRSMLMWADKIKGVGYSNKQIADALKKVNDEA